VEQRLLPVVGVVVADRVVAVPAVVVVRAPRRRPRSPRPDGLTEQFV